MRNVGAVLITVAFTVACVLLAGCSSHDTHSRASSSATATATTGAAQLWEKYGQDTIAVKDQQCRSTVSGEDCLNLLLAKRNVAINVQREGGSNSPFYAQAQAVENTVNSYSEDMCDKKEDDDSCDQLAGDVYLEFAGLAVKLQYPDR